MKSPTQPDAMGKFVTIHNIIESYGYMHCPAILTNDIEAFPEAIEFIRLKTQQRKMVPQLHGSNHFDYAILPVEEIQEDYKKCQAWFMRNFGIGFTKHYTPWGGNAPHLRATAAAMGIEMVDTEGIIDPRHVLADPEFSWQKYCGKELFIHWWFSPKLLDQALAKLKAAEQTTTFDIRN